MAVASHLDELDATKRDLEARFPGWQIWYVPHLNRTVTWCARPNPLLDSNSPEHLEAEIVRAHAEAAEHWPALAREVPALREDRTPA